MRVFGKRIDGESCREFNSDSYSNLLNTMKELSGPIPLDRGQIIRFNSHEAMNKHMEDAIALRMKGKKQK